MQTAIIYARYSSDRQTEQSIEGQLRVCQEYAERNNITIVDTYIDRAMTGTNDNRPAFKKMLQDSNKKAWDIVLVYKLDRFSRDKYEMAIHRRTLRNNSIKLVSAMENIPDTPEGIILESLLEGMNQYYSLELSQKVKRGMRENRKKGYFSGGTIPYGYRKEGKKLAIDTDCANVVCFIYSEYASGKLITEIVKYLNDKGIQNNGRPFALNSVYKMLKNEYYTGVYRYGDETYYNIYPRIVPQDLFNIVQNKININRYGKHKPNVHYLLKNKVRCGYCGGIVKSDSGVPKNGIVYRYYRCTKSRREKTCEHKAIVKEVLENLVVNTILETLTDDMINFLASEVLSLHKNNMKDKSILNLLTNDYEILDKKINNMLDAIENGFASKLTRDRFHKLEEERAILEEKILIEKTKENLNLAHNEIVGYIKSALSKSPQIMIDLLVREVIVYNDKIEIYLNYIDNTRPDEENHQAFSFCQKNELVSISSEQFTTTSINKVYNISLWI